MANASTSYRFVALALYYAKKCLDEGPLNSSLNSANSSASSLNRGKALSLLALGLGICFKNFQILLRPIFAVGPAGNRTSNLIKLMAIGSFPFIAIMLPFLSTEAFRKAALMSNQSQRISHLSFDVAPNRSAYIFLLGLFASYFYVMYVSQKRSVDGIWKPPLAVFAIFYFTTFWHPQWYLWSLPFLVLAISKDRRLMGTYMIIVASSFAYIQEWGNPLTAGRFYPVSPVFREIQGTLKIIPRRTRVLGGAYTGFIVLSLGMST
jgi:hypothetical protein